MTSQPLPIPPADCPENLPDATPDRPGSTDSPLSRPRVRLWMPITTHAVADFFSFVTIALMPLLAVRLGMDETQKASLLALGAAASGGVQPLVAWINDRFDTRMTGTIGLAMAAVCIGLLGYAQSFPQLVVLFFFGVLGVGAFHPASASAVGQLAGKKRSAMLSVFFLFGMLGGVLGNVLSPQYVHLAGSLSGLEGDAAIDAGLHALIWFIPPGLAAAALLAWAIHKAPHRDGSAHDHHSSLPRDEQRRRWHALWLLYACNVIRTIVNLMLVYLTVEWTERLVATRAGTATLDVALGQQASELNGPMQGSMQIGMGVGALALGFLLPRKLEKTAFVVIPIMGAVAVAFIPYTDALLGDGPDAGYLPVLIPAGLLTIAAGVGFGSLIPVSLSLAQRLIPHRTALASGLMLGGAWCVALVGPFIARAIHAGDDANLERAFLVGGGVLLLASALAATLPGKLLREVAPH